MKFTTKTGDNGITDMMDERVEKCCDMIEFIGTLDEAASVISVARSFVDNKRCKDELSAVISCITKIASLVNKKEKIFSDEDVSQIEEWISYYEKETPHIRLFEYPSDKSAAVTDYARCVVRRVERCAVRCKLDIRYLNRLSDYLFVLSRYLECGDKI